MEAGVPSETERELKVAIDDESGESEEGSASKSRGDEAAEVEDPDPRVDVQASSFLAGISMDPAGKRPPVCYMFARGKCTFQNCKYSHDPSDVKKYLEAEKHKDLFEKYGKKVGDRARDAKPAYGAKGTSPGVKPTYTSILRGPGSAARKTS